MNGQRNRRNPCDGRNHEAGIKNIFKTQSATGTVAVSGAGIHLTVGFIKPDMSEVCCAYFLFLSVLHFMTDSGRAGENGAPR